MPETYATENEVIADLAELASSRDLIQITDHRAAFILREGQRVHEIDLEQYAATPLRKKGAVTLADADSFIAYVGRHQLTDETTLWSDIDAGTVVAVIDDHHDGSDTAGWGQHRATLRIRQTEDWKLWLGNDGKLLNQDEFAEHLESGVDAIRDPDAATMLEIAQNFHASSGASIKSGRRLSGEIQFSYDEQVTATAGRSGSLEVPETFTLGLSPFEGNEPYAVTARLRFRLADGNLRLGYRLLRPDRVRKAAFDDIVGAVTTGAGLPVMAGTPRS